MQVYVYWTALMWRKWSFTVSVVITTWLSGRRGRCEDRKYCGLVFLASSFLALGLGQRSAPLILHHRVWPSLWPKFTFLPSCFALHFPATDNNYASCNFIFTLKMATTVFYKTLNKSQHTTGLSPKVEVWYSCNELHNFFQYPELMHIRNFLSYKFKNFTKRQ